MERLSRNISFVAQLGGYSLPVADSEEFRRRLAEAVRRAGRKAVARPDGESRPEGGEAPSQGGLSKILSGARQNPGIFTVKAIADGAGVTVGELLGEKGFELTDADRQQAREVIEWFARVFEVELRVIDKNHDLEFIPAKLDVIDDDDEARRFPVPRDRFKERDYDYPQPWHHWVSDTPSEELPAAAAGSVGVPNLLNPRTASVREIVDRINQIIKVNGDSMEGRYFDGDLVRVDTRIRRVADGTPIAVYCEELDGSLIGLQKRDGDRFLLVKKNRRSGDVLLPRRGWWFLGPIVELVSRQERPERVESILRADDEPLSADGLRLASLVNRLPENERKQFYDELAAEGMREALTRRGRSGK